MLHLDLETAKRLVDLSIAEKGEDFVYKKYAGACSNVHGVTYELDEDGEETDNKDFTNAVPGCLVGDALHKGGISLERLYGKNQSSADELMGCLRVEGVLTYDRDAEDFLYNVQVSQDNGASWGRARSLANEGSCQSRSGTVGKYSVTNQG